MCILYSLQNKPLKSNSPGGAWIKTQEIIKVDMNCPQGIKNLREDIDFIQDILQPQKITPLNLSLLLVLNWKPRRLYPR